MGRERSLKETPMRKLITFDLNQKALEAFYPKPVRSKDAQFFKKAYKDIERFMRKNGFEHPQYSVYTSKRVMDSYGINKLIEEMVGKMPWLGKCINEMSVTDIAMQYDLTPIVIEAAHIAESPEPALEKYDNSGELIAQEENNKQPLQDMISAAEKQAKEQQVPEIKNKFIGFER